MTAGTADDPGYEVVAVGGDSAMDGPVTLGSRHPLPGPGTRVAYDDATQQVHVLGRPRRTGRPRPPMRRGRSTSSSRTPNAVYADAAPAGRDASRSAWAMDVETEYPADDREQLLVFGADGQTASIDVGSHAFAWRLPGVIAGALMALCLYLLARILFRRRLVAGLVGVFVLLDGMLFVQSRIGMNDVYVGLFIVAAYTLFAAVWTGWWRWRRRVLGRRCRSSACCWASRWPRSGWPAYAIGALGLLLLVRSALGRVVRDPRADRASPACSATSRSPSPRARASATSRSW